MASNERADSNHLDQSSQSVSSATAAKGKGGRPPHPIKEEFIKVGSSANAYKRATYDCKHCNTSFTEQQGDQPQPHQAHRQRVQPVPLRDSSEVAARPGQGPGHQQQRRNSSAGRREAQAADNPRLNDSHPGTPADQGTEAGSGLPHRTVSTCSAPGTRRCCKQLRRGRSVHLSQGSTRVPSQRSSSCSSSRQQRRRQRRRPRPRPWLLGSACQCLTRL